MKKRIIALILCFSLVLVCACKKAPEEKETAVPYPQATQPDDDKTESVPSEQAAPPSDQKEKADTDSESDMTSASNENDNTVTQPQQNDTAVDTNASEDDTTVDTSSSEDDKNQDDTQSDEDLFNYEVTDEPFEQMEIRRAVTSHKTYANEQELFDAAEMVFIGMPLETFTDGDMRYYDFENEEVDKNSDEEVFFRCTVRNIKVLEMLKGDKTLETVAVADRAAIDDINGTQAILGLPSSDRIAKKNVKYIYYLIPALPDSMDFYFIAYDSGLINIDGLDSSVGRADRVLAAKEKYSEYFEKYDRSSEPQTK